jgi:hypothetical protein
VGPRAAEPLHYGRRPTGAGEGNGPMQPAPAPAYGWWHQSNGRRSKAGKVSRVQSRSGKPTKSARWAVPARLADRVVVAMMPLDSTTGAEQRTRGQRRAQYDGTRPDMPPAGQQGVTTPSTWSTKDAANPGGEGCTRGKARSAA